MRVSIRADLGLLLLLAACGDPGPPEKPGAPSVQDVSGTYEATTFTTQEGAVVTDQLARGSSIHLVLNESAATSGQLFVPGGAENGSDLVADLMGTWALRADTVTFAQSADTFMRDMAFVFAEGRLSGQETFSNTIVRVVLTKQ